MEYILAKKIIQTVKGGQSWFGVSHNANIYRGCNHGCIYCDSRSSCYQIPNFDEIKIKSEADVMIDRELSTKSKKGVIGLGGMTDPYNVYEKQINYTRNALKSMDLYGFGVHVITKSSLVERDIDLFKRINRHSYVNVGLTITTHNDKLQSRIERNVSSTSDRFNTIRILSDSGIYTGILMMPLLPFINDTIENVANIVEMAKKSGAKYIYPSFGVTLRANQRQYFFQKIGPELTKKYIETYGESYYCASKNHKILKKKFEELCQKYGILYKMKDIVEEGHKYIKQEQVSLF